MEPMSSPTQSGCGWTVGVLYPTMWWKGVRKPSRAKLELIESVEAFLVGEGCLGINQRELSVYASNHQCIYSSYLYSSISTSCSRHDTSPPHVTAGDVEGSPSSFPLYLKIFGCFIPSHVILFTKLPGYHEEDFFGNPVPKENATREKTALKSGKNVHINGKNTHKLWIARWELSPFFSEVSICF